MATRQDSNVMEAPGITRTPRYEGSAELGGPNEPGDDFDFAVEGVAVGGTYWCGAGDVKDGERWASWGPAGGSWGHFSREQAEQVQVQAYLETRRRAGAEEGTFSIGIYMPGGGYLVELCAWTWAEARGIARERWTPVNSVRVLDEDDRTDDLEPVDVDQVDELLERHHAKRAEAARERAARRPQARADRRRLRLEAKAGIRYSDGWRYGTPRSDDNDPRFTRADVPEDAFAPHAAAVLGVLERATYWTWADAQKLARVWKRQPPAEDRWEWMQHAALVYQASQAAGRRREEEVGALDEVVRTVKLMITPIEAARKSQEYTRGTALWDEVFDVVLTTGRAYLLAELLPREAFEAMTWVWRTAFPDDVVPELD